MDYDVTVETFAALVEECQKPQIQRRVVFRVIEPLPQAATAELLARCKNTKLANRSGDCIAVTFRT